MDHAVLDFREMPLNCIMDFISNAVRLKKGQVPVGNNVDIDIHLSTKHTGTERIDPGYATLLHNETFHFLDGTAIGRMVDPINEVFWRDALRAEHMAGDINGVERLVTQLSHALTQVDPDYAEPEQETEELITQLRRRHAIAS